jgi:alkylation response protein AidB-like acyl-CoA dehydrogenase
MTATFDLPEATRELQSVARDFARGVLAPHALDWDERRHFPVDVIRQAAALGMAAIYVRENVRRHRPRPARRGADLRGAGDGLSDGVGLSLDPQHGAPG